MAVLPPRSSLTLFLRTLRQAIGKRLGLKRAYGRTFFGPLCTWLQDVMAVINVQ